ncbi:hypothetical protein Plec18167_003745 [Paecilomyces lecythidis]|uniref:Elongation of fatty acids protein n=1 Tax=Paecilomyces lecythidis TaxID=3004212 RepID=A0ABR3XWE8_9EURO
MFESLLDRRVRPNIYLGLPTSSLFEFPPNPRPDPLPAPLTERTWEQPFNIPPALYAKLLDVRVPITIASVYAVTVVIVNRINKSRGNKPWAISKTRLFKAFVILHNVFLAVYSAWTFAGMFQAFRNSMPDRDDPNGIVGVADALCKINGPRGLGNGAMFNPTTERWEMPNAQYKLAEGGVPDPTDVGRLWNQGLAYFGWIFYLSKFYEVLDTAIILAKGKRSSTLQTYHHAGAMMCMWAGIRYVAPPIWIFALVNSAIHALMYTYYTLTALSIRIPNRVKRSLTTMQITQFVVGTAMAAIHLFISYDIPVSIPSGLSPRHKATAVAAASSAAESGIAAATAAAGSLGPWLKKLAFRAAGAEGIAENVLNAQGQHFGVDAIHAAKLAEAKTAAQNALEYRTIDCLDTSGQAFAVWLNVMYLLPLTYLFGRFFVRSYLHRKDPSAKHPTHIQNAEKAGMDALKGVSREIHRAVFEMHGDGSSTEEEGSSTPRTQGKVDEKLSKTTSDPETIKKIDKDAEGFSKVPAKGHGKRSKKGPETSPVEESNPFGVLEPEKDVNGAPSS